MFTSCSEEDDYDYSYLDSPYVRDATQNGESIVISWDKVDDATSYKIYRGDGYSSSYSAELLGSSSTTSYTDKSPLIGYNSYWVQAINSSMESDYSNSVGCTYTPPPLPAPTGVTATQSGLGILISWNSVPDATGYIVTYNTSADGYYEYIGSSESNATTTATTMTVYFNTTPSTGTTHYFKVQAINGSQKSSASSYASCTYSNPGGGIESGIYLGVIGFNQNTMVNDISLLTNSTKYNFTSFINSMTTKQGTVLYYAVESALNKLKAATFPDDLVNVSIVTFTDGLDQRSVMLNDTYHK
ncbi:hypothetical protein AGMMS49525_03920 [Bacteroidia bacterium]|nr:hypothetical protein AGMMS49525_03890 [Bacteroidia bacterium]GHT01876.1 hypothetical protein AGMMS49525_03920 [Bacteroidia bacterium]